MRDKLIELLKEAKKHTKGASCDIERIILFADYLLANGVIVLPCKIGGVRYEVGVDIIELWDKTNFTLKKSEKTVFLTREEAEQALKRQGGKNDA